MWDAVEAREERVTELEAKKRQQERNIALVILRAEMSSARMQKVVRDAMDRLGDLEVIQDLDGELDSKAVKGLSPGEVEELAALGSLSEEQLKACHESEARAYYWIVAWQATLFDGDWSKVSRAVLTVSTPG